VETLKLGTTLTVREPGVLLDPTLAPGKYRVTLVVLTDRGESEPAELRIVVRRGRTPGRPIITPTTPITPVTPVVPRRPITPVGRFESAEPAKPAQSKRTTKRKSPTKPKRK
jgi:hypothetical protein